MHGQTIDVLEVEVHDLTRDQLLGTLDSWSRSSSARPRRVFYTNAHVFNEAAADARFRATLNSADLLLFEGFGGCIAARLLGHRRPEQLATMDWMDDFLARLAARGGAIYLVGDEPSVAMRCAEAMLRRHSGLRLAGARDGFFAREGIENEEVVGAIAAAKPDVLMVGMGSPVQEYWIDGNLDALDVPVTMALGAMFRWYADVEPRAPRWMRQLHLEWLMRLARHPLRHFRRYVMGNPLFLFRVFRQRLHGSPRNRG